jgi:Predicted multitransmembrane protein
VRRRREAAVEKRRRRRVIVALTAALVPVVAALVLAGLALWPSSTTGGVDVPKGVFTAPGTTYVTASVRSVQTFNCQGVGSTPSTKVRCAHVTVRIKTGPEKGTSRKVDVDPTVVKSGIESGDSLRLARFRSTAGAPVSFAFSDFSRSTPLIALAVAFAVLVVVVARIRGLAALFGLALSFLVLLRFMIPALLSGENPLAVGLVGSAAIMFVLLYLAHGVSIRTTTALIGTLFGLGASTLLAAWAVSTAHLTGVASEDDFTVAAVAGQVRLSGLLLCGIIVASLGILNDVTVTQASAVWELHALSPDTPPARLFSGAMRIGRDHIASTVYTIVFAYAGAALPILLLINLSGLPLGTIVTNEALAEEIVRTLVGSIGLVLSVPLTTVVGVALVRYARGAVHQPSAAPPKWDPTWTTRPGTDGAADVAR